MRADAHQAAHAVRGRRDAPSRSRAPAHAAAAGGRRAVQDDHRIVDLERRRDQLSTRVAELQWDLGGLVYEMAVRDRIRRRRDRPARRRCSRRPTPSWAEVERILQHRADRDRRRLRHLRRAAQQRRRLLLAVRPAAARAGPEPTRSRRSVAGRRPGGGRRARGSAEAPGDVVARCAGPRAA